MLAVDAANVEDVGEGVGDLKGDGDLEPPVTICNGQSATRSTVCTEQPYS
jgi:hypothetical protein